MLVVEDVLICWMYRMRIVRLHANIVFCDLHVLSGNCERGEGLVPHSEPAEMLCVCEAPRWLGWLARACQLLLLTVSCPPASSTLLLSYNSFSPNTSVY